MTKSKAATLEKHRFLCLVVALALVAATVMSLVVPRVVRAAQSGDITCNFTIGNAKPIVMDVELCADNRESLGDNKMTPQLEYAIRVMVADPNTLDDLKEIVVTIFLDQNGNNEPEDDNERDPHPQRAFKMTWADNGTWTQSPATEDTTWALVIAKCGQPSLGGPSGDFWFHFKPGKVATEATEDTEWNWDIYVEVTDDSDNSNTEYHMGNYEMMWYGEIDVTTPSIAWDNVTPGTGFSPANEPVEINYISNGHYKVAVSASADWNGAILNPVETPGPQEFSLKASPSDNISESQLVPIAPESRVIDSSGTQTGESGYDSDNNHVWLKLGTPFVDGTYSGTITFHIRNL